MKAAALIASVLFTLGFAGVEVSGEVVSLLGLWIILAVFTDVLSVAFNLAFKKRGVK